MMLTYRYSNSDHSIVAGPDGLFIPVDDENRLYRQLIDDGAFIAPYVAPPMLVPASITRRQCARKMHAMGLISGPEMVAMTRNGQPPAMVAAMLSALPDEQRWVAEADFAADTYERSNPLLIALMNQNGSTDEEIDQFFRAAGAL